MLRKLQICSHLLKKSLTEDFIFYAVHITSVIQKWAGTFTSTVSGELYHVCHIYLHFRIQYVGKTIHDPPYKGRHCVKSVRIWSYSGPYFPPFGLNTKVRENTEQNNSEYGHSLRSANDCKITCFDIFIVKFILVFQIRLYNPFSKVWKERSNEKLGLLKRDIENLRAFWTKIVHGV